MTLNELKELIDAWVNDGQGDLELVMDNNPEDRFDIEFLERDDVIGVRTNDNY